MSNSSPKKKGFIYARVSSEEQKKSGYSLASQIRLLEEKMKREGVAAVHPPIMDVESGRSFAREGLKKLIKLAKSGSIDYVYVYDLDRLGRNVVETPYLMYRTQQGKIEKFRQGKWVGPIPFGYRKNVSGELEKLPELEPIVADILQTYKMLDNIKKVTRLINNKYSDKIGKFSANQIRRILTNSIYIGNPRYGKIEIHAPALAMVAPELYNKVQRLIKRNARKFKVKKYRKPRSILDDFAAKYGMDYVMRVLDVLKPHCPKCQTKMVGNGSKPIKGLRVPNFKCPACGHQRTIPLASELERFQSNSLSCPNCRSVENFDIRETLDGFKEYACRRCGFSFRMNVQYLPELDAKEERKKESVQHALGRGNPKPENCFKYNSIDPLNYTAKYSPESSKKTKKLWRKQKEMEKKEMQKVTKQKNELIQCGLDKFLD